MIGFIKKIFRKKNSTKTFEEMTFQHNQAIAAIIGMEFTNQMANDRTFRRMIKAKYPSLFIKFNQHIKSVIEK